MDLTKRTAPYVKLVEDEANQFPYIIKEAASARTEKAEESSVQNEEDGEESSVQAWEAEYAQAVCNDVFRSMA